MQDRKSGAKRKQNIRGRGKKKKKVLIKSLLKLFHTFIHRQKKDSSSKHKAILLFLYCVFYPDSSNIERSYVILFLASCLKPHSSRCSLCTLPGGRNGAKAALSGYFEVTE